MIQVAEETVKTNLAENLGMIEGICNLNSACVFVCNGIGAVKADYPVLLSFFGMKPNANRVISSSSSKQGSRHALHGVSNPRKTRAGVFLQSPIRMRSFLVSNWIPRIEILPWLYAAATMFTGLEHRSHSRRNIAASDVRTSRSFERLCGSSSTGSIKLKSTNSGENL